MAIKMVVSRVCDRCMRPFGHEQLNYAGNGAPFPGLARKTLTISETDATGAVTVLAKFEDLCEECDKAVLNNIKRIRLEKDSKDKAAADTKAADAPKTAPEGATAASTTAPAAPSKAPATETAAAPAGPLDFPSAPAAPAAPVATEEAF